MDPTQKYNWCLNVVRNFFKFISMDVFAKKLHYGIHAVIALYIGDIVCYFLTIVNRSGSASLISLSFQMGFLQLTIVLFMIKWKILHPMIDIVAFIHNVYEQNANVQMRNYGICKRYSDSCELTLKIFLYVFVILCLIMSMAPILEYFLLDIKFLSIDLYIPGFDENDDMAFIGLMVVNNLTIVINFFVHNSTLLLIYVIFIHVLMLSAILVLKISDLNHSLRGDDSNTNEIKESLIEIIYMHRKYIEYVRLNSIFLNIRERCFYRF